MKRSITLDAGHGGNDPGAVGPKGLREKDVALAVTRKLGAMLTAAGLAVNYTRTDDRFLELHERAQIANEAGTDLFLSIHCNSASKRAASGFEVFTTPGQTAADVFATCLFMDYARAFPTKLKRIDDTDGDPDKEANFAVLRLSKMPAALFELDFISSPAVEAWLADPLNQIAIAEALCDGVLRFFEMVPAVPSKPAEASAPPEVPVKQSLKQRLRNVSTLLANLAEEAP
jgi:N-acetylmuramoyl-L-alanine amidase